MEQRFREDENELPYLVVEKRDPVRASGPGRQKQTLDGVLNSLDITDHEKSVIRSKLVEFSHAKGVRGLRVEDNYDAISFNIIRENEYITTTHEFIHFPGHLNEYRVFFDCYTTHDYTRLLANPRFKRLIDSTPYEFLHCSGGYQCSYRRDVFTLIDELDLSAVFNISSKMQRIYHINLDTMSFEERYFDFNMEEFL